MKWIILILKEKNPEIMVCFQIEYWFKDPLEDGSPIIKEEGQ